MNRFHIRLFNDGDCEILTHQVNVEEGQDYSKALRMALLSMVADMLPEPGDTIKIERG